MGSLILLILIIVGVVWAVKSTSEEPEDSKENLLRQIKQINVRVSSLENELRILKGFPDALPSKLKPEFESEEFNETEKQPIETEYLDTSIKEEFTKEPAENTIEEFEGIFNKVADIDIQEKKEKKTIEIESYLTSNLFNKIGAVALILGVGFFLKYAFDNSLFNPFIQIFLSFLFSGGLIFGASHFFKQDKYKIFAQGIAGAGIGISYLTIYSAYSSYQLFNYPTACIFMLITTIIAFFQSLKYDSMATAILALIGGFVTPFIISSGNSNFLGLLTYLVFLNVLVVSLIYKKDSWKIIGILSSFVTYLTYFALHMNSYNSPSSIGSMLFLTLIWALYFVFDIVKIKSSAYHYNFLNIENGTLFYLGIYNLYANDLNSIVSATFLISFAYLFSGIAIYFKHNRLDCYLKQNFYAFATLFAIATNFATAGFVKPILFSVEAFMLLYFGSQLEKSYIQKTSATFFAISYITLLCNPQTYSFASAGGYTPIFNFRDLTFIALIGLTIFGVKIFEKAHNNEELESYISFYRFSWASLLFLLFSVEINDVMLKIASYTSSQTTTNLINFNKSMINVIVWALYSIKLLSAGIRQNLKAFTIVGFAGTLIALVYLAMSGLLYTPIESFIPLINLRCIAFIVMVCCLKYLSNIIQENKTKYEWAESIIGIVTYIWCTLLFVLFFIEIGDTAARISVGSSDWLKPIFYAKGMLQATAWIIYSVTLLKIGFKKDIKQVLYFSLFGIGISIAYLFIQEPAFANSHEFMPIINFRCLAFVISSACLIFAGRELNKNQERYDWCKSLQSNFHYLWALILFLLLNFEIGDYFASYNYAFSGASNAKQLVTSLGWLIYSVMSMYFGILKRIKPLRKIALIVLVLTILKVFIFDLSFLDQLGRIIAFMGLGAILLLLSFFYQKYSEQIKKLINQDITK